MTAIVVGRLPQANFIVVDAMVGMSNDVKSHLDCCLRDKISEIGEDTYYLVLCGEGLIADTAGLVHNWCIMQKIKLDLFKKEHFTELLKCAIIHRKYNVDIQKLPIIPQPSTHVYIVNKSDIKEYAVMYNGSNFIITHEFLFPENHCILNYAGTKKILPVSGVTDLIEFGKASILNEYENKQKTGNNPLKYDLKDRFSTVLLPSDPAIKTTREFPFKEYTELYLSDKNNWGYVYNAGFKYTPTFN